MLEGQLTTREDIVLKRAAAADFDLTFAIKKSAGGHYIQDVFGWDEKTQIGFHERQFSAENTRLILRDGTVVGWVSVFDHTDHTRIGEFYVLPEFQNAGIGTAVLLEAVAHASRRNVPLHIRVFGINRAVRLYERLGFQKQDEDGPFLNMKLAPSSEGDQRQETQ